MDSVYASRFCPPEGHVCCQWHPLPLPRIHETDVIGRAHRQAQDDSTMGSVLKTDSWPFVVHVLHCIEFINSTTPPVLPGLIIGLDCQVTIAALHGDADVGALVILQDQVNLVIPVTIGGILLIFQRF